MQSSIPCYAASIMPSYLSSSLILRNIVIGGGSGWSYWKISVLLQSSNPCLSVSNMSCCRSFKVVEEMAIIGAMCFVISGYGCKVVSG